MPSGGDAGGVHGGPRPKERELKCIAVEPKLDSMDREPTPKETEWSKLIEDEITSRFTQKAQEKHPGKTLELVPRVGDSQGFKPFKRNRDLGENITITREGENRAHYAARISDDTLVELLGNLKTLENTTVLRLTPLEF